jgi:hypothetical protein
MNHHAPYFDWMQTALDEGEAHLAPEQRTQLERHLANCLDCQSLWEAFGEVERLFTTAPLAAPQPGFTNRFQARLDSRRKQSRPRVIWGVVALGLGSAGLAALAFPLGIGLLFSTVQVMRQPATGAALYSGLAATADFVSSILNALLITLSALAELALVSPFTWPASLTGLAVVVLWVYFVRKLAPGVSS